MSRVLGEIRPDGYVVCDIESAMKHWTPHFDTDLERRLAQGDRVEQSACIGRPEGRFVHLTTEAHPGTVIELSDVSGAKGAVFQRIGVQRHSYPP